MEINFAERMNHFKDGIFSVLNAKKRQLINEGRKVYDFSVGTPDFKPEESSMKALMEAAKDPDKFKYAIADLPELTESVIKCHSRCVTTAGKDTNGFYLVFCHLFFLHLLFLFIQFSDDMPPVFHPPLFSTAAFLFYRYPYSNGISDGTDTRTVD